LILWEKRGGGRIVASVPSSRKVRDYRGTRTGPEANYPEPVIIPGLSWTTRPRPAPPLPRSTQFPTQLPNDPLRYLW